MDESKITFDNFIVSHSNEKAFELCRSFTLDDNHGCFMSLHGPSSCGKTHLLTALEKGVTRSFQNKIVNHIPYFEVSEELTAKCLGMSFDALCKSDLLIIDNLQLVKCKNFFQQVFAEITSNVLKNGGNVIVAHNCPASNLKLFFDNVCYATDQQMVEIKYPDMNLMRKYLKAKQIEYGIELTQNEEDEILRLRWSGVLSFGADIFGEQFQQKLLTRFIELFGEV